MNPNNEYNKPFWFGDKNSNVKIVPAAVKGTIDGI